MTASRRRLILEAFRDRVVEIQKVNGYLTDAGKTVFLGENPKLGPDDPDTAIALVIGDDEPGEQTVFGSGEGASIEIDLLIGVQALTKADIDAPLLAIEDVIQDIKNAIELTDRGMGDLVKQMKRGPTVPLDREEGSAIVGASVSYELLYVEDWGDP